MQCTHRRLPARDPALTTGWEDRHPGIHFRAAVLADLHDKPYDRILPILAREKPDIILIPGDLTEDLQPAPDTVSRPGLGLLREAAKLATTFYAFGNHETGACHGNLRHADRIDPNRVAVHPAWRAVIRESGAVLLDETWTTFHGLVIGGFGSGLLNPGRVPDCGWIADFAKVPGYKLLLCHQPEYYDRYLRPYDIDLFVAGHAHGGQWRLFGRGVYAPDQPLFPKYTSGVHEGRLVISRGLANTASPIPRIFNPCEVVMIEIME